MPTEKEQETTEVAVETVETTEETSKEVLQASEDADGNEIEIVEADFSELTELFETDGEEEIPPVETAAEETETPAEETPPEVAAETVEETEEEAVEAAAEEKPAEVKEEVKEELPKVEAKEPEPEPELKVPTKEELDGMYQKHREETLPTLEKLFTLTEEEAAALDEQPSKIIPKLAGQMMYDTMLSTYNAVLAAMPSVVNRLISASSEATSAEGKFFDEWPDLAGNDNAQVVSAAIKSYRSSNPRADLETVIKNAGVLAMINLGKDPMAVRTETKKPDIKPKVKPAKPAAPRGSTQQTAPVKPGSQKANIFDELATLHDEDNA